MTSYLRLERPTTRRETSQRVTRHTARVIFGTKRPWVQIPPPSDTATPTKESRLFSKINDLDPGEYSSSPHVNASPSLRSASQVDAELALAWISIVTAKSACRRMHMMIRDWSSRVNHLVEPRDLANTTMGGT
jgi:hypothetical protein